MLKDNLICPKCRNPLFLEDRSYKCKNNHCYDIAKEGYLNLLLSKTNCGDQENLVKARINFLNKGFYDPLLVHIKKNLGTATDVLDCGCGVGYYSQKLADYFTITGIDISKEAIRRAAKQDKISSYIVCSSNSIPIQKKYFDGIYVIFAPLFEESMESLLKRNGKLIVVHPGTNHLYQIKEKIYNEPYYNSKPNLDLNLFDLTKEYNITYDINLNNYDLRNLIGMTPYLYKTNKSDLDKLNNIDNLTVTIDFLVAVYNKKCYYNS